MNISLKKVTDNEIEQIRYWRMMPDITKYMYTDPIITSDQQVEWYKKISNNPTTRYWVIVVEGINIGVLNLNYIDYLNKHCCWGYYIADQTFKGKGIAGIIEYNIYEYVFNELRMNKLWCEVFSSNDRVIEIHKRFGSEVEGVFQEHIFKNGEFHDVVRMAITKKKWERIKANLNKNYIRIEIE